MKTLFSRPVEASPDVIAEVTRLRARVKELEAERSALESELAGRSQHGFWQVKGVRQRKALDRLHDRVVAQRFVLRLANQLGHLPGRDEFQAALSDLPQRETDRVERYLASLA